MGRLLKSMSQEKLGDALGITFQQIQKYEKGTNRVGAGRLQQIASTLNVPPAFFFEGHPSTNGERPVGSSAPLPSYVADFLASADGLALMKAFTQIAQPKLRRSIVGIIQQIVLEKK